MGFEVFSGGGGGSNTPSPSPSSSGGFAIFAQPNKSKKNNTKLEPPILSPASSGGMGALRENDVIAPPSGMGALREVESRKPVTPPKLTLKEQLTRPIQAFKAGVDEGIAPSLINKGLRKADEALGNAPTLRPKFDPRGLENIPYFAGRVIGDLPTVLGAYATGGVGATAALSRVAPVAPKVFTNPITKEFVRGLGAGATHGTMRAAAEGQPIEQAVKTIGTEAAMFGVGDPAFGTAGRLIKKAFAKPKPPVPAMEPEPSRLMIPEFTTDSGAIRQRGFVGQRPALPSVRGETAMKDYAEKTGLAWPPTDETMAVIRERFKGQPEIIKQWNRVANNTNQIRPTPQAPTLPTAELNAARNILNSTKNPATAQKIFNAYPQLKPEFPKLSKPLRKQPLQGNIKPPRVANMPGKMEPLINGQRVRSLGVSAANSKGMSPEVQQNLINEMVPGGRGAYDVHSNERTLEWADRIVKADTRQAERYVRENPGTDLSNTVALKLIQKANAEGRFMDATDLIQHVSETATNQGQAIQSLRLWGNMTPEGMQKYYVKIVGNINRDLEKQIGKKAEKLQVKPEIMADIKGRMEKIGRLAEGRDKDIEIAKTLDLIASQVPIPFLRKVASIQTMAQLLNPKTAIRNTVGNFGFAALENVSNTVGAAIDKPLSLLTGQRTKVLPSLGAQAKGFKQGWKNGLEDALLGIDTSGIANKFDLPKGRVFRGGPLGFAEKALNIELRATDRAFYQAAYEDSLLNQMRAAKVNTPTEEMRNIAHLDGLYRTFQDDNALSNLFIGVKRLLNANKEFGIGDFIIKYPKTPANLLMRGVDYSPAGFVKTILEAAKPLTGRQFNQKAFVESLSRALVGSTALFGTGAILHKLGIITSRPPEDRDLAELQRQSGFGDYRINVSALKRLVFGNGNTKPQNGDTIISYDWFQPPALSLAIGADVDANKGSASGIVGTVLQALGTGINAFAEQPVVQGIQTLFSGGYGQIDQGLIKVLEGVPASFVPTLLSQVRQLIDNQRRETYDPNKTQESLNRAKAKMPGLAGGLPKKYGTLGQPLETYPGGSNTPFNVFLNPAFVNEFNPSSEVQKVNSVYKQTGETKQVPRVVPKKITVSGQDFVLSGPEYAEYQRLVGEYTRRGFAQMSEITDHNAAAKAMQAIISDANEYAKVQILKARGEKVFKKGNGLAIGK
jgi:hypothetical protein